MPKVPKGKGKGNGKETAHDHDNKPYTRTTESVTAQTESSHSQPSAPHRNNHLPHPPKAISLIENESSSSNRRRKNKKKRSRDAEEAAPATFPVHGHVNGHAGDATEMKGAHAETSTSPSSNHVTEHVKPDPDAREAVRRRIAAPETNGVNQTPAELIRHHEREVKDLRRKVSKLTKAEEEAERLSAELLARIAELEETVATQKADMTKTKDEIEGKERLIHEHGSRNDSLRELLQCGVCMEAFRDPHTLQCGHTACLECLHEWFRSPNAYPAHNIEQINEEDDLSYRTKICHMCRTPIFRRPARNIILSHVLESIGLATGAAGVESASKSELDSMWSNIFPPEPKSWVVRDEADNVTRCPNCGCEVDYGECVQCGAAFSVAASDGSEVSAFDYQDRVDLGNGLLLDQQLADHDVRARRVQERLPLQFFFPGLLDDEAEDDEGSMMGPDEVDDYDAHLFRTLDAAEGLATDSDSEDTVLSDEFWDDDRSPRATDDDSNGSAIIHIMDSDVENGGLDGSSPPRRWSPSPGTRQRERTRRPGNAGPPAPPSDITDGSYESSFIDDDDDVQYVSDDALDAHDNCSNPEECSEAEGSADDGSDVDEPSIEELRRRRAARYGDSSIPERRRRSPHLVLSVSPSPPAQRREGRTRYHRTARIASPTADTSVELLEEMPVRRPRIPRRQRVIHSDSE
ncbi:hypothetical protein CspeluHIS016_0301590 [Cutaneotrichosporon spelunceum]|uniref:RING-type domain-containing protein n=1 Tax=Cutaneotrichosporon spelunceum TaxID=1672016 RepID=A0AAD3YBZ9_9TREE|nr:hypothetical protein CspeluHIS016_0301590 [Cutaneotrichosporon spelunceum]